MKIKITIYSLVFIFAFFSMAKMASADTHYMPAGSHGGVNECANLQACFQAMAANDTLLIADGTYTGTSNSIMGNSNNTMPKNGTGGNYTTIKAVNPGKVIIDGQNTRDTMCMSQVGPHNAMNYVVFDGLQFVNSGGYCGSPDISGAKWDNRDTTHIKFLRCGFQDNVSISYASYILLEDCYVTGRGRYNMSTFADDHVIFRRCVMRMDNGQTAGDPFANGVSYGSDHVEWQNCLVLDNDDSFWDQSVKFGAFGGIYFRKQWCDQGPCYTDTSNAMRGVITLNTKIHPIGQSPAGAALMMGVGAEVAMENGIYYDLDNMMGLDNGSYGSLSMDHMTIGKATFSGSGYYGTLADSTSKGVITNSLYFNLSGTALYNLKSSNYNAFYGNGTNKSNVASSANDVTNINPLTNHLKYLVKMENAANLDGNDGKKMGAEAIWKYGVDGTLYGDAGYATLRNAANGYGQAADKLWPFPQEDTIRTFFINYGTGGSSPSSTRGFCASGKTLSGYILNYLNPTPAIRMDSSVSETVNVNQYIYSESGSGDTTPPAAPSGLSVN